MYELFINWMGELPLLISDDVLFIFVAVGSLFILNFILDFFRYVMYYITER